MEHEETSPTPERAQHGELTRSPRQVPDANGDIGFPWRATGILAVMERRGSIDADMRKAGERFGRLFYAAHLDPIKAADMCRVPGLGGPVEGGRVETARRAVHDAMRALGGHGSPAADCAWHVLGAEMTLKEWAMRESVGSRGFSPERASGVLFAALGILSSHFK